MAAADVAGVLDLLERLPGVRDVRRLAAGDRHALARIECDYESASAIPVLNVGVRSASCREEALVILKDRAFRPPPSPTVFLVEPVAGGPRGPFEILVEGARYRVIGEELLGGAPALPDDAVFLAETFVMYPSRRTGPAVPCTFILPPIPFPELEARRGDLAIADIVSVSPSLAVDMRLREICGYPQTNELATLLVGFNPVS
jgi:hypothetical protein